MSQDLMNSFGRRNLPQKNIVLPEKSDSYNKYFQYCREKLTWDNLLTIRLYLMKKRKYIFKSVISLLMLFCWSVKALAANYYWVGGSGNWSDIGHWRTVSGGTALPTVVPGPTDNVFFDSNSGFTLASKTITLNVTANCYNIKFSGSGVAPALNGNGKELNIYGSSEWQAGMSVAVTSIYYRNKNTPKTIKSNSVSVTASNVFFYEENSISLADDFSVSGNLQHNAGTFISGNYKVTLGSYIGNSGTKTRTLTMGSSEFYISGTFSSRTPLLVLNSGTSGIILSGNNTTLDPYEGQIFYNVTFENSGLKSSLGLSQTDKVYYNRVEFKGDGKLTRDNEIKELILSKGKTYSLQNNATQTITSSLKAHTPDCGAWIMINSSLSGTQAGIVADAGVDIDVSGVIIRDIDASGGAAFTAVKSVDSGNNTGWNFPVSASQNLYWVGGSGNWDDKGHWSQTSGGPGGYCMPGPTDNVFFDSRSGFTSAAKMVTINVTANCHDITFSGSAVAPALRGSGKELNIYGSSEWQMGMSVGIMSVYYRNSRENKTVKANGVSMVGDNVFFDEENSISLLDNLTVAGALFHNAGTLNTNNYKLTLGSYYGDSGTRLRVLNMGSSDFYISRSSGGSFSTNSSTAITVNAGTSHIHFLGTTPVMSPYKDQTFYNVTFEAGTTGMLGQYQTAKAYYNRVEFRGDGSFIGDSQIRDLIFAEGKTYSLQDTSTQTITSSLVAHASDCGDWIMINSSTSGTQARLVAAHGVAMDISRVIIRDIDASGGAVFTTSGSADGGNNTGWNFSTSAVQNLYWVGGSGSWNDKAHWSPASGGLGGFCIPGPFDNVFFDADSGFSGSSKTVTLNVTANCQNIIFSGSTVVPTLSGNGKELNIYGSSEWQSGMTVGIGSVYYRNTSTPKTIKSNGASVMGDVYFDEESSVSLLDDFSALGKIRHHVGTWNTNDHTVTLGSGYFANYFKARPKIANLGSSELYISGDNGAFSSNASGLILNAGTSSLHFTGGNSLVDPYTGQTFNNVSFEESSTSGQLGKEQSDKVYYNHVEFKGDGKLMMDNEIKELILMAGRTYALESGKTQTVTDHLYASGNSCFILFLKSSTGGIQANLNVQTPSSNFDFANVKDINASGEPLHFGSKSSNTGNNNNIIFDPYSPGSFSGFAGQNWSCAGFNNSNPSSYTLSSAGFYGNPSTVYEWTKIDDPAHTGIISTKDSLDMRPFGYGVYHIKVTYSTAGSGDYCVVEESITVKKCIPSMINPGLPLRNY